MQGKTRPGLRLTILVKALLIRMPAVLVGCRATETANVSGLHQVVGTDLLGAGGLSDGDQRRIDQIAVRLCAGHVYSAKECALHSGASNPLNLLAFVDTLFSVAL